MTTIDEPPLDTTAEPAAASGGALVAKKKHSLALRWMHWINFPVLMVMMWSGMRIYWADLRDPYGFGILGWQLFEFWPDSIDSALVLDRKLAKGIAFHLNFGWFFVLNGAAYLIYLSRRGRWRYLVPDLQGLKDAPQVVLHDLRLRKQAPPQGKYNSMQQITYSAVIVMSILLVASGFAIYKPAQLSILVTLLGGYDFARFIHFSMTILLLLFFFVHLVQVARSGWNNFTSIITGYVATRRDPVTKSGDAAGSESSEEVAT